MYRDFAEILDRVLTSDGIAILLTVEKKLLEETMKDKFNVAEILTINQGGLKPSIFKLTRKK